MGYTNQSKLNFEEKKLRHLIVSFSLSLCAQDEIFPHQDRQVRDYVIHPEYYHGGLHNDIALLFLTEPVEIVENVNTVCLPNQHDVFDHSRCFASGWGKDLFGKEGKYQVILKRVELPIVPRDPCIQKLRTTRLGSHFRLHNSFICAGGEKGRDTCKVFHTNSIETI